MTASQPNSLTLFSRDNETGEVQELPLGTRFITPEQRQNALEACKARRERESKQALIDAHRANQRRTLGTFCFLNVNDAFTDVSPPTVAKIVMLASYADFRRQLMLTAKTPMKRADISKVLGLSRSGAYKFWNDVNGRFFTENENHFVYLNTPNIFRGKIPKDLYNKHLQKVYIKTVRELYRQTSTHKHKQLGYIFQLLQYVNLEFNILCVDPFQDRLEDIEPLTVQQLCWLIGYNTTQAKRLTNDLKSLKYCYHGRSEYLLAYVDNGEAAHDSKRIFVNPHIVYNGSDYRRVEILGSFCSADKESSTFCRHEKSALFQPVSSVSYG